MPTFDFFPHSGAVENHPDPFLTVVHRDDVESVLGLSISRWMFFRHSGHGETPAEFLTRAMLAVDARWAAYDDWDVFGAECGLGFDESSVLHQRLSDALEATRRR